VRGAWADRRTRRPARVRPGSRSCC
jgi:hypothetical protein